MERTEWSPADLLQLSGGYWSACALHAGVKLDVFTPLSKESLTASELSGLLKCSHRGTAMLLNALSALNLVVKREETYAATPFSAEYLSRDSDKYLGHIIMHHHHLMDGWARLDESVASGLPVRKNSSRVEDETARESFLMGMYNLAMQLAPRIVRAIDLKGRRRLLDLGGGPGTYAIQFCLHNPDLTAVVYDLPTTRSFAEKTVSAFELSDRIRFEPGDFLSQDLPSKAFDVAWLSHILHGEGPEQCAVILRNAARALTPGGILLVQEFVLNYSCDGPVFPALFSLNMLIGTQSGQSYSQSDLVSMLAEAGLDDARRIELDLPNGAGIIAGIKPR